MSGLESNNGTPASEVAKALRIQALVAERLAVNARELGREGAANVAVVIAKGDRDAAEIVAGFDEPLSTFGVAYSPDELRSTGINIRRTRILATAVNAIQNTLYPIGGELPEPRQILPASLYDPYHVATEEYKEEYESDGMATIGWKRHILPDVYSYAGVDWGQADAPVRSPYIRTRSVLGLTIVKQPAGIFAMR